MTYALILSDPDRRSYRIIGRHLRRTFERAGVSVIEGLLPADDRARRRVAQEASDAVVFHSTVGPLFKPLPGVINVALPLHEWSRYPAGWVARLNRFDAVWSPSRFVARVLRASGLTAPLTFVPPALDVERPTRKLAWSAARPFRFLACGEAHFRKGFHLLIAGFLQAFPDEGVATLTIKTPRGCHWQPPRGDIVFDTRTLTRRGMLDLYQEYDAFVSASLGEGLGLPVAEAIMAGLPVVAHRWGGHADLLAEDACFSLPYHVVDQPFASDPSYYAPGQRCALSGPRGIATALRRVIACPPLERARVAESASAGLLRSYGAARATPRLRRAWRRVSGPAPSAGRRATLVIT